MCYGIAFNRCAGEKVASDRPELAVAIETRTGTDTDSPKISFMILTLPYFIVLVLNLIYPWMLRRLVFKRPVSLWIAVPSSLIATVGLAWVIDPLFFRRGEYYGEYTGIKLFTYVPLFLWLYSPSVMSYGFQSRKAGERETKKEMEIQSDDEAADAESALKRGVNLLAQGKSQDARKEFEMVLNYWPKASAATLAASYLSQMPAD